MTCDRCRTGIPCISLCCPHGYVIGGLGEYYDYDEQIGDEVANTTRKERSAEDSDDGSPCVKSEVAVKMDLKFKRGDEETFLDWEEDVNYILVGPQKQKPPNPLLFSCPLDDETGEPAVWVPDTNPDSPTLFSSGILHGVIDENVETNANGEFTLTQKDLGQYCVTYEEDAINTEKITYGVCHFKTPSVGCEKTREIVFNTGFTISLIFIAMAIIAHLIEPQLRDSAFGKISICYLLNLFMAFAVVLHSRVADYKPETRSCIWIGYLQQYFFIAFFAWINAMAIFFRTSLGSMQRQSSQKKILIAATIYAQGLPLVVCLITYGVDLHTPLQGQLGSRRSYPEMGVYSCYLGSVKEKTYGSYFTTPEFIYVQSFQLVLLVCNLVLFILSARTIIEVRANARPKQMTDNVNEIRELRWSNFVIVLKLYIYMVCVWMFEIVTSAIAAEYGTDASCTVRFILDTPNAFYGLIIFGVLVCSKQCVRRSLREKVTNAFRSSDGERRTSVFSLNPLNSK